MSNHKEIETEIERIDRIEKERIKEIVREELRKLEKLEIERIKRKILEVKRKEREIEEIATQILNERRIKKVAKNQNVKLRKESKEFILNTTATISNKKILN